MLEAQFATVRYGARCALSAVGLQIMPGEFVALCGPNGAGKSTLLSVLAGDLAPSEGAVFLEGQGLSTYAPADLALKRAVLEQTPSLGVAFTVRELAMLGLPRDISPAIAASIVDMVMARLGLSAFTERVALALSGGEQHRAHLARVLAQIEAGRLAGQGQYLFLDEPTASLDIAHQITVMRSAQDVAKRGTAAIVVLHDLNLASAFADRIILMDQGQIISDGTPDAVLTAARLESLYATPFTIAKGRTNRPRVQPEYSCHPISENSKETPAHVHSHEPLPRSARSG